MQIIPNILTSWLFGESPVDPTDGSENMSFFIPAPLGSCSKTLVHFMEDETKQVTQKNPIDILFIIIISQLLSHRNSGSTNATVFLHWWGCGPDCHCIEM